MALFVIYVIFGIYLHNIEWISRYLRFTQGWLKCNNKINKTTLLPLSPNSIFPKACHFDLYIVQNANNVIGYFNTMCHCHIKGFHNIGW